MGVKQMSEPVVMASRINMTMEDTKYLVNKLFEPEESFIIAVLVARTMDKVQSVLSKDPMNNDHIYHMTHLKNVISKLIAGVPDNESRLVFLESLRDASGVNINVREVPPHE